MPPDLPIDLEINLKKRARRRLVGAVALVLLMLIILPIILQDRASLTQTEAIKITMPEPAIQPALPPKQAASQEILDTVQTNPIPAYVVNEPLVPDDIINQKVAGIEKTAPTANVPVAENKPVTKIATPKPAEVKSATPKAIESKVSDSKPAPANSAGFTIQIGVYSDMANVKQIQGQLTQAGLISNTEKVATPKGEKIRLNAGSFTTREAANKALEKLQALKVAGFVKAKN